MTVKEWLLARIRDDAKHAEIDEREARSLEQVDALHQERIKNGFGQMFAVEAGLGSSRPVSKKRGKRQ